MSHPRKLHITLGRFYEVEGHRPDGTAFRFKFEKDEPILVHDEKRKLDFVYEEQSKRTRVPAGKLTESLDDTYTALHEGASPNEYFLDRVRTPKGEQKLLCTIDALTYWKRTKESSEHLYRHPFELAENLKPSLAIDSGNQLYIVNQGHLTVTERGIEDTMKDIIRANPITIEGAKRVTYSMLLVSATALVVIKLLDMAFEKIPQLASMTGYKRSAIELAAGLVGAILIDAYGPPMARPVAAGFGIGGGVAAGQSAYAKYSLSAVPSSATSTPAAIAAGAGTNAAVPPSGNIGAGYYQSRPQYGRAAA